jgi:5'-nucleotidase
MFDPLTDLTGARILISNDDGIHGPGLEVLERVAARLSDDVWTVVPETEQSGSGHSLTLHHPLRIRQAGERRFAVDGTPTDCVLLAVNHILRERRPHLVLSGVNRGANLGEDVTYSGTVAAAMEGTLLGIPSIALSQVFAAPDPVPWATAEAHAAAVISKVAAQGWASNVLINVNFPSVSPESVIGIEVTCQGTRKLGDDLIERHDPRGRPYIWIGAQRNAADARPGTDREAIARGAISVTPLCVDLTDGATLRHLKETVFP